jgi:hypothetical protein
VVYLCFGSLTHVSQAQLRELALGLEAYEKPFLWVIRSETWVPPEGWKERVGDRGMVITHHRLGSTDCDTGAPCRGCVCDALRVELGPGNGGGWCTGADMAYGV